MSRIVATACLLLSLIAAVYAAGLAGERAGLRRDLQIERRRVEELLVKYEGYTWSNPHPNWKDEFGEPLRICIPPVPERGPYP